MTRRGLLQSALAISAPASRDLEDFARRIFARINELRVIRAVPALEWSERIAACAREQSMRREKLRFSGHSDPERGGVAERLTAAGIFWTQCGENLFRVKGYDDPVSFAVVFWWYSAGHQANMLNPAYTQSGIGLVEGADESFFVTQIFLSSRPLDHPKVFDSPFSRQHR